jgi:hypothetical protein
MPARKTLCCAMVLACVVAFTMWEPAYTADLETDFRTPPQVARPSAYWLWLNGYANHEYLDQELKAFADQGVGGLCIFDMGARGNAKYFPPAGPPFMSEESLETISRAIRIAKKHGLAVQLAACSSWDLGGSWVTPAHASMGLYRSELTVGGPSELDEALPLPSLPAAVPRDADGKPAFLKDVAVIGIAHAKRQPAHEFIFRLPRGDLHRIDRVVLFNTESDDPGIYGESHLYTKDFSVAISTTDKHAAEFHEIVVGSLKPNPGEQSFTFPPTNARYVRLRLRNGHNREFDTIQLGEFEVYSTDGVNVGASFRVDRTRDTAELVWFNSEANEGGKWTADKLNDGRKSGPNGSWRSAGLPPLVVEDLADIVDLTDRLSADGRLRWHVPAGTWTVMRFVCGNTGERLKVPSPNSDGLATDHFNAAATRHFIETLTSRLEARLGDLPQSGLHQLYLPSYEVRGAIWTPDFLDQFRKYRHYDMRKYLPVLAGYQVENDERTFRFLYDFQKTLGDLLVDAYYRTASRAAHDAGLGIEAEAGGPGPPVHQVPVDALKALGAIDEMRGEFWPWRMKRDQLWVVKETACAAHIYGRKRVHMEAFTGFRHWEDGPFELKPAADRAFCEGMNHVVWHTSSHQPPEAGKPGWVYGAGTHLTPNLAWWSLSRPFIDYLARCSYMLQQGLFVGDVCYYYGDQGSNFVPPKHVDPSLGYGYDYDVANPEVILTRMTVRDGRVTLPDGMQYELLVLPDRADFDLSVLQKIEQLVQAGATVVGPKPTRANGLTDFPARDRQVRELADKLWGNCDGESVLEHQFGKGRVIWGRRLSDILKARGRGPDFTFTSSQDGTQLDFIHRRTDEADIYFVSNKRDRAESVTAEFRVTGKRPELWLPDSAETRELVVYEPTRDGIRVPLSLGPVGSAFLVFRKPLSQNHLRAASPGLLVEPHSETQVRVTVADNGSYSLRTPSDDSVAVEIRDLPRPIPVDNAWKIRFPTGWGAPNSATFTELKSWTAHEDSGIKYFSGIGRYETECNVPPAWLTEGRRVFLDLGRLWAVGHVRVNGDSVGTVWKPPYRVDITVAAHAGMNRLEIEVANTWSNRLVGDTSLPEDERFCRTNITVSGTPGRPWKNVPLRECGLLGPVRLVAGLEKVIAIKSRDGS